MPIRSPLNLILMRTPLILESKTSEEMSWDLGYHHARRGHDPDPSRAGDPDYKRGFEGAGGPRAPKEHYTRQLFSRLPEIARTAMAAHVDANDERNRGFLDNPDSPAEHAPKWHQWGVVTHTKMFGVAHEKEVVKHLQQWGVKDAVDQHFAQEIDGEPKRDLIKAGIALHDLGKFTHRIYEPQADGSFKTGFANHEVRSGELIREPGFADTLKRDYSMTDNQVEYIAKCAELHFELGILRNKAKEAGGWSMAYVQSPHFEKAARDLMQQHPGFEAEMGLLYMGDSMAKTNIRIKANSDEEIEAQRDDVQQTVDRKLAALPAGHKFDPRLIKAAMQLPVNMAAGKRYMQLWAGDQQPPARSALRTLDPQAQQDPQDRPSQEQLQAVVKGLSGVQRSTLGSIFRGADRTDDLAFELDTDRPGALRHVRALEKKGLINVTSGWDYKGSREVTFDVSDHGNDVGQWMADEGKRHDEIMKALKAKHAARRAARRAQEGR